jgi:hypothetical protein
MLKRRFINSHFILKILEALCKSCLYHFQFFSDKRSSIFGVFFNLVDVLSNLSDILHNFVLFSH